MVVDQVINIIRNNFSSILFDYEKCVSKMGYGNICYKNHTIEMSSYYPFIKFYFRSPDYFSNIEIKMVRNKVTTDYI
jgi:hypothetical protein